LASLPQYLSHSRPSPAVAGLNSFTSQPLARILAQEEAAFSAASFALASALAAVRAARSECHAAVIYCVNRPNGSASTFVSGL